MITFIEEEFGIYVSECEISEDNLGSLRAVARFVALVRSDFAGVRAGFFALLISSGGDLVTGREAKATRAERDKALDLVYKQAEVTQRALEVGAKGP